MGICLNNKLKKLVKIVYSDLDLQVVQDFIDEAVDQTGYSTVAVEEEVYKMISSGTSLEDMIRYKRFPMMLWCVAQLKENEQECKIAIQNKTKKS